MLETARARIAEQRAVCDGVEPADFAAVGQRDGLPWLIRAADAGETAAMIAYARHAFVGYDVHLDRHAPEIAAEAPRVREYLSLALALGDPGALVAYGDAYSRGFVFESDPLAAYAYYFAYTRTGATDARMYESVLVNIGRRHAPDAIARARERGAAILAACCRPPSQP